MTDLAKLVVRLEAQSGQYLAELDKANKKLDKFGKTTESTLKKIAGGITAYLSGRELLQFSGGLVDVAEQLSKMSQKVGISTESLSQLKYAFGLAGIDIEKMEKSLISLGRTTVAAAQGSKEAADAFAAIGVSFKNSDGSLKSQEQLLFEIADRFSELEDGLGKTEIAIQLFGKQGAALIPALNGGADAIRNLMMEADQLGQTISTDTGLAAGELNDNIGKLKASFTGVVNTVLQQVVPALADLSSEYVENIKQSGEIAAMAERITTFFKVMATGAVLVSGVIGSLGKALGAVVAAVVKLSETFTAVDFSSPVAFSLALARNFHKAKEAAAILKDGVGDIVSDIGDDIETINRIWDGSIDKVQEVNVTVKKLKETLNFKDPKIAEALRKDMEKALKTLNDFNLELQTQVATFGKSESELVAYRLAVGDLSDEVAKLGESGQKLAASINENAQALERMKNANAIAEINAQIMELTGSTKEAALAAFDLANAQLKASLEASNDTGGLERLNKLRELTAAQEEFNELQEEYARIQAELERQEQRIQNAVLVGAESELEAMKETGEAREVAAQQLQEILDKMNAIAESSGNPALKESAASATIELENLLAQVDLVEKEITGTLKDGVADFFGDAIKGTKSWSDSFEDAIKNIRDKLLDMAMDNLITQLFNFAGAGTSGGMGGFIGMLGAAFGGSMDDGGHGKKGTAYKIGTGAQPEWFIPGAPGTFVPEKKMGGGTNVFNYTIQAPRGTVSRRTEQQVAAATMRGMLAANRRNN